MKASLLIALLLLSVASAFDRTEVLTNFLDSEPHPLVRVDFDFPSAAVGYGSIEVQLLADFGYYKIQKANTGHQVRYYDGPDYLRDVEIFLRTPAGLNDIYLGTFFNNNPASTNDVYLITSYAYYYYPTSGKYYYFNNLHKNIGYYNTLNVLQFYFAPALWEKIVAEGQASLIFKFSDEVNSYYKLYPFAAYHTKLFHEKEFLSVTVRFPDAAALGDPHFFGWNGESFDFQGEHNNVYNLISHKNAQVNFQMKQRAFFTVSSLEQLETLQHNTYIGSLGCSTKSHTLRLFAGEDGFDDAGYIELDGKRFDLSHSQQTLLSDSEMTVEWKEPQNKLLNDKDPIAAILYTKVGIFSIRVYFIEAGRNVDDNSWHSHPFRFFNLYASIEEDEEYRNSRIHGVLGQTGDHHLSLKAAGAEKWVVQGSFEDYRVSDLFSHDFKFNLFAH